MKYVFALVALFVCNLEIVGQTEDVLIRFQIEYSEHYRLSVRDIGTSLDDLSAEDLGKDRVVDTFIDAFYQIFHDEHASKLGLAPRDINSYDNAVNFDNYGYPQVKAKKAAKAVEANRYFGIEIKMERGAFSGSDTGGLTIKELGLKGDKKKFKPRIIVRLTLFDSNGKKIKTVKGTANSKDKLVLKQNTLLRLASIGENKTLEEGQEIILTTYRRALEELVEKF